MHHEQTCTTHQRWHVAQQRPGRAAWCPRIVRQRPHLFQDAFAGCASNGGSSCTTGQSSKREEGLHQAAVELSNPTSNDKSRNHQIPCQCHDLRQVLLVVRREVEMGVVLLLPLIKLCCCPPITNPSSRELSYAVRYLLDKKLCDQMPFCATNIPCRLHFP